MYYLRRARLLLALIAFILILVLSFWAASHERTRSLFVLPDERAGDSLAFIADIYKRVAPSVVGVESLRDDGAGRVTVGSGSGVILNPDGYIVTNYHVVEDATVLSVTLADGRRGEAVLIAGDPGLDLALLQTELNDLAAAELGRSKDLQVGDVVFPIGNPGGEQFARSMTMGLISGIDRQLAMTEGSLEALLQTDAAINPGNSGGPLVDCHGVVIGINSAKIVDADFEGMGFAIPADTVRSFLAGALPALFMP